MGGGSSAPQFKAPTAPKFTDPYQIDNLEKFGATGDVYKTAMDTDRATIVNTRNLWGQLNPNLRGANRMFQQQVSDEVAGRDPNLPAVRDALLTSGLQGAAGSFGDTGRINTAATARNLGVGIADYAGSRRAEARGNLGFAMGLPINQPTQVGYTGKDALELALQQASQQNNFNTAANQNEAGQSASQLGAETAQKNQEAQKKAAAIAAGAVVLASLVAL